MAIIAIWAPSQFGRTSVRSFKWDRPFQHSKVHVYTMISPAVIHWIHQFHIWRLSCNYFDVTPGFISSKSCSWWERIISARTIITLYDWICVALNFTIFCYDKNSSRNRKWSSNAEQVLSPYKNWSCVSILLHTFRVMITSNYAPLITNCDTEEGGINIILLISMFDETINKIRVLFFLVSVISKI